MKVRRSVILLAAALLAAISAHAASPRDAVRAWRVAHEHEILADFERLIAKPNVATTLPDVEANAVYIAGQLEARGFKTRLLRAEPGTPPSVFAERITPGAKRTVVFYAHYDGQPINQKGWLSPPFQPTLRTAPPESAVVSAAAEARGLDPDWRLYGRSTGDDKASIQAMISALDALKAAGIAPTVNIKLL
jgi:acetylornithine deacetylase/succinyl-diaminopimelate desuccinylase-like protein